MSGATPERRVAAEVLARWWGGRRGDLEDATYAAAAALEPALRRAARARVSGVMRALGELRWVLEPYLKSSLEDQAPPVAAALLVGAWELRKGQAPAHVAVHQAVSLAPQKASKFVNAVLRGVAEDRRPRPLPDRAADPLLWAEVVAGQPAWLVQERARRLGVAGSVACAAAETQEPPIHVRFRGAPTFAAAPVDGVPGAFCPTPRPDGPVPAWPGFEDGAFSVQDGAAQLVASLVGEGTVLDVCAAPGGKAALLADAGRAVVAMDSDPVRVARMAEGFARLRLDVPVSVRDALAARWDEPRTFDTVLVDAPCTGLGVIRRHPEIPWVRRPGDPAARARVQLRLLENVVPAVRAGGALVYAVCTWTQAETDGVVADFLAAHDDFTLEPVVAPRAMRDGATLRTWPHLHDLDGFFAAVLRRR